MNGIWKRCAVALTLVGLLLAMPACSGDSDGDNGTNPSASQLEGTWNLTEYTYTSVADPSKTENILQTQGISVTMTISADGSFTVTTTVAGQSFTSSGNFNENDGEVSSPDPDTTVDLNGNTLTVTSVNGTWDFGDGNGDVPATARQVYQKQ